MARRAGEVLLTGARLTGWLAALAVLVGAAGVSWTLVSHSRAQALATDADWDRMVRAIRACRRAGPRPMIDWRICEDRVLAAEWRNPG